jgi:serine/threonine protein phosphatase 1
MSILRLPANHSGRDFVCGDIHGSFSCVEKFMKSVDFDPAVDRLISAGDIIDRGPDNEACLELLYEDWFFACMGNHEHMMFHYSTGQPYGNYWTGNGGKWGAKYFSRWTPDGEEADPALSARVRKTCEEKIQNLPLLITVEKKSGGVFHVLHAELPIQEGITDADLADEYTLTQIASTQSGDGDVITWGRNIFYPFYYRTLDAHAIEKIKRGAVYSKIDRMFNDDLSHIYSGHTICAGPVTFYGQTNLDTMAFGSYSPGAPPWAGLTVTEPETGRFWRANDREFVEIKPLVITKD